MLSVWMLILKFWGKQCMRLPQISHFFAGLIALYSIICAWSKSLQEWGTHNFSSFWKKTSKEFQFCALFFCAIVRGNYTPLRIRLLNFFLFFSLIFFLQKFKNETNNSDHYGSTPYHSSHVRLEKKVDIRWGVCSRQNGVKGAFLGQELLLVVRLQIGDSAKLKTSDCVVILSKITSCQSKGY